MADGCHLTTSSYGDDVRLIIDDRGRIALKIDEPFIPLTPEEAIQLGEWLVKLGRSRLPKAPDTSPIAGGDHG